MALLPGITKLGQLGKDDIHLTKFSDCNKKNIIFMRSSAYFSQLKDSLFELVKKSTDTIDSSSSIGEEKLHIFKQIIRSGGLRKCSIISAETKTNEKRSYAQYLIEVKTNKFIYIIPKRFSEFEQFYSRVSRIGKLETKLPPKTFIYPGWSEDVTAKRIPQLNHLLDEINNAQTAEAIKIQFYHFIKLDNYFEQLTNEEEAGTDQNLLSLIGKLNENQTNSLNLLHSISKCIYERKKKISYEMVKQLLAGFQENEGLIPFLMRNQNELIQLEGFKILFDLLLPQTNRESQIFGRVLSKFQPSSMILAHQQKLWDNCELKKSYFQVISQYLYYRQELSIQSFSKLIKNSELFLKEYLYWQKFKSFGSY